MIKRSKKCLLTALLSLAALGSHADRLYVQDTQVLAGGECDLNIVFESSDISQYCAFQFDLVLPEDFEKSSPNMQYNKSFYSDSNQIFYNDPLPSGNGWRVVCHSPSNLSMTGQGGVIATAPVKVGATAQEGSVSGTIQNIVFTKLNADGSTQTVRMAASSYSIRVWKAATVTARSYTRRYGEPNPAFGYDVTGGQLQGTPLLTCDATATTAVGTYDIRVSQGTVKNPYVTYIPGKLTIVSASSALVFDPVSKTYGDASFTVSPKTDVSGGAITYSSGNTQVVTVSGQSFTIVGAGTATITANQAATANYGATSTTFTVSVAQAPLTIAARSYTRKEGEPNPKFEASYDGFRYGETEAVLAREPQFRCSATPSSPADTYTIEVYGAEARNYSISYQSGTLTVTPADPVNKHGDLNGDDQVNGTDLVVMIRMIMEQQGKTAAADLNGDGLVNGTDLVALIKEVLNATK